MTQTSSLRLPATVEQIDNQSESTEPTDGFWDNPMRHGVNFGQTDVCAVIDLLHREGLLTKSGWLRGYNIIRTAYFEQKVEEDPDNTKREAQMLALLSRDPHVAPQQRRLEMEHVLEPGYYNIEYGSGTTSEWVQDHLEEALPKEAYALQRVDVSMSGFTESLAWIRIFEECSAREVKGTIAFVTE